MLKYREETMKNVGLIGCGTISNQYLMNLSKSEDVKVIACADQFRDRAESTAKKYGIPKRCTVEELLQDAEVEIVLNLTVPAVHKEINLAALSSGKHVYCEKPFA